MSDLLDNVTVKCGYGDLYEVIGERLLFTPMKASLSDGMHVTIWRNQPEARAAFWNTDVVTPDSHVAFITGKPVNDLVWLVHEQGTFNVVGMAGLIVDPKQHIGEAGRYYVDRNYRGKGYAVEIDRMVLAFAFDWLRLESMWLDAWATNEAIIATHKKAGWQLEGLDLPGHTRAGGRVIHMTMTADGWRHLAEGQPTPVEASDPTILTIEDMWIPQS